MKCNLCPRCCDVDRTAARGFCRSGALAVIARIAPHYDEEPLISGTRGAGTIFFSGCTLRCVYCQNYPISSECRGVEITPYRLSEEIKKLESQGVHNIEFVTPTHFTEAILESLSLYRPQVPIVWNCSGYERIETLRRLEGIVDVWLPDFKYSDNILAERLSAAPDYRETALGAIGEMLRQQPRNIIEDGLLQRGVLIRHLVLPSHVNNSLGALELIADHFPTALVSVMSQYLPLGRAAEYPDIDRRITRREYTKVLDRLCELELEGFAQELSSADNAYVPEWDYT